MCDKAVDNYPHVLEFVLKCFKTQKMCITVNVFNCTTTIEYVPDRFKTQVNL